VNAVLVVVQIVSMIVFIVAVAGAIHPSNLTPFAPFGWSGISASTALVFFAYIGFDTVTVASEEAKRPERDVPIGIILALVIGGLLYVALTLCTVGVVKFTLLSDGAAMLDALAAVTKNQSIYWIVAIGGLAGNFTVMLTSLLGQIRIFYVMARDRMLPPAMARVDPRFRTPLRTTLVTGTIVAVFAAGFPLTDLLLLVNIGTLAAFAIVCIGVLVLRFTHRDAVRPFRAPLLPVFAVCGAATCLYLVSRLDPTTWVRYLLWFLIGVIVYGLYGFWSSRLRSGIAPPAV
jgi:APA family basic amino acid/polyamine antiporter